MLDPFKELGALEAVRRGRARFNEEICRSSLDQSSEVLEIFRLESMFEFAEFYFVFAAMGFTEAKDIMFILDAHDRRIDHLLADPGELRRRKIRKDRILAAVLQPEVRSRIEAVWRENPGSFDQSALARLLLPQLSVETTRKLVIVAERGGFLTRRVDGRGGVVVKSTGKMEEIFARCIHDMRKEIREL